MDGWICVRLDGRCGTVRDGIDEFEDTSVTGVYSYFVP